MARPYKSCEFKILKPSKWGGAPMALLYTGWSVAQASNPPVALLVGFLGAGASYKLPDWALDAYGKYLAKQGDQYRRLVTAPLSVGCRVTIQNCTHTPELNERDGVIIEQRSNTEWVVAVAQPDSDETQEIAVTTECLRRISSKRVVDTQHKHEPPEPPDELKCPITMELFRDPVRSIYPLSTEDNANPEKHLFERAAIEEVLSFSQRCPMTCLKLTINDLKPAEDVKQKVKEFTEYHNL